MTLLLDRILILFAQVTIWATVLFVLAAVVMGLAKLAFLAWALAGG